MDYQINVAHNVADGVWYVLSSDVVGLNAEAQTLDELVALVGELAPQLLELNDVAIGQGVNLRIQHTINASSAHAA